MDGCNQSDPRSRSPLAGSRNGLPSTQGSFLAAAARKRRHLALLAMGCCVLFVLDVLSGPAWLSLGDVFGALFAPAGASTSHHFIVWSIRLPTAVMALAVGATLGVAGAYMQTILANPLASPYTLGVSAGASFGAALAIVFGFGLLPGAGEYLIPLNAFVFSLLTCMTIVLLARSRRLSVDTLILAGIAMLFLFQSLLALLQYLATEEALQAIVFWMFGSLYKATWIKTGVVAAILGLCLAALAADAWRLTALKLGDDHARSLGIDTERLRFKVMLIISVMTATAVSFVGTIGFVGLIAPHVARTLVGEDQRYFTAGALLTGMLLLSFASLTSKLILPGAIFPIGIVTSLAGVPFFLWIIAARRRRDG
mgnify:CR=1 FL=1